MRSLVIMVIIIGFTSLTVTAVPDELLADSLNEGVFAIDSNPYGLSYEDWTIKWWQWLLSIPVQLSPMEDNTGERCQEGQGNLTVFFLSGSGGSVAERTCTIPA